MNEETKALLASAEQGDADAMFELAEACFWGRGAEENPALAREWYEKAALCGHTAAATALGIMLLYGDGVPKDLAAARRYLEQAAATGDEEAEDALDALEEEEAARAARAAKKAKVAAKKQSSLKP